MSKITAYTAATRFDSGDKLLKDGTNGTKTITVANAAVEFAGLVSSVNHRNVYRGKYIGSAVTDDQKTAISEGTFDDLFIGDWWKITGSDGTARVYRIADMDYWWNTGDTWLTTHHLVIVPDAVMTNAVMNSTDTTDGGYVGSEMYTETLPAVKEIVSSDFGDLLLTHREYFVDAVTDGHPAGAAVYDSSVELMNELMVYGSHIVAPARDGSTTIYRQTMSKTQLALFSLNPALMNIKNVWWLRDVASSFQFALVNHQGAATFGKATYEYGVRPAFAIGVTS